MAEVCDASILHSAQQRRIEQANRTIAIVATATAV
jgi:hypothetical protein